jgi:UrcA family protein
MKRVLVGMFYVFGGLAVAGAFGAGLAPLPDSGRQVKSLTVSFGDLDLGNTAGVNTLYARLRSAARRVCGTADLRNLRAVADVKRCRAEALDDAVARIDHPRLTALHRGPDGMEELAGFNLRPAAQL